MIRECWACSVVEEEDVALREVKSKGRMDVVAKRFCVKTLTDVVIDTTATNNAAEVSRRARQPGRSLRTAASRKLARYGPSVLAFALEDTGRLGSGTVRLLQQLAADASEETGFTYQQLLAELQHVGLVRRLPCFKRPAASLQHHEAIFGVSVLL